MSPSAKGSRWKRLFLVAGGLHWIQLKLLRVPYTRRRTKHIRGKLSHCLSKICSYATPTKRLLCSGRIHMFQCRGKQLLRNCGRRPDQRHSRQLNTSTNGCGRSTRSSVCDAARSRRS